MKLSANREFFPHLAWMVVLVAGSFATPFDTAIGATFYDGGLGRPIELEFEECIFPDLNGIARTNAGVTLGIPLTRSQNVCLGANGRPQLSIEGGSRVKHWQFSAFELEDPTDPTSPVVWATLDLVLDSIQARQPLRGIYLDNGLGASAGSSLAADHGPTVEIDTGKARFMIRKNGFSFIEEAWAGSTPILGINGSSGVFAEGRDGEVYSSRWGTSRLSIVRNGPACAKIMVEGDLASADRSRVLASYVCELTAYAETEELQGRLTLIGGHTDNMTDLLFNWAHVVCYAIPGSDEEGHTFDIKTTALQPREISQSVTWSHSLTNVQFQTDRPLFGDDNHFFYPGLPKNDFLDTGWGGNTSSVRIRTGYRVKLRESVNNQETDLISETDPSRYPFYQVMDMVRPGTQDGVTALCRWSTTEFPTAVEGSGQGFLSLELWTDEVPESFEGTDFHYNIRRHYSEAKEFVIGVHSGRSVDVTDFGTHHTFDVEGRFRNFQDYGMALYREESLDAISPKFQTALYRYMGLFAPNEEVASRVRDVYWDLSYFVDHFQDIAFLEKNRTGGKFNNNYYEQDILAYLRFKRSGRLLRAKSYIDYVRGAQFEHLRQEDCQWDSDSDPHGYPYVTSRGESDVEHDWWRSVRLWARLKGDHWLRTQFLDHARTLKGNNDNLIYYRGMVKSLEELGLSLSLARHAYPPLENDPCIGMNPVDHLYQKLSHRLDDWFGRIYDPADPWANDAWVSAQGAFLPQELGNPWTSSAGWPFWGMTAHLDRGCRHEHCYDCDDPNCRSYLSQPFGRRLFHEHLAMSGLAIACSALDGPDPLRIEAFFRISQLAYNVMGICHWSHQDSPCGRPYPPPWTKQGDAAHVYLPPHCDQPGYDHHGPFQDRSGDGHMGYPYAGQGARHVLYQYAILGNRDALQVAATKFHEILATQRFRDGWNQPCPGSDRWENNNFDININDPAHWAFLMALVRLDPTLVRADYPALNPESRFH